MSIATNLPSTAQDDSAAFDLDFDPQADKIREECGIFGIFGIDNASSLTALGLHALQHRGQDREQLVEDGALFQSTSDTEVLIHLIARARGGEFIDRFVNALRQIDGGYAFVGLTDNTLIGARDRLGIRPLLLGRLGDSYILASETCAFDMVDAEYIREIEPGEVVAINSDGIRSFRAFPKVAPRPCVFEFVYFARPDSIVGGKSVYNVRKRMGQRLAQETPADVDVIIPVPDSGVPAAIGFSQETGVPFELGIIRNHYVGRTFIQPTQQIRDMGVRLKHSANRAMIEGKRVLITTSKLCAKC